VKAEYLKLQYRLWNSTSSF